MEKKFLKAFADVVREEVARKNKVKINGLGIFKLEHKKQFQKQYENGRVVMMPPKDRIRFISEN
jgi:nucleoid DNA-binding protein